MAGNDPTAKFSFGPWISEEEPDNSFLFPDGFIVGFECAGDDCDRMLPKVLTSQLIQNSGYCRQTPYFSEEDGKAFVCDPGYFVAGFRCNDDYCDNISLSCCQAKINWP